MCQFTSLLTEHFDCTLVQKGNNDACRSQVSFFPTHILNSWSHHRWPSSQTNKVIPCHFSYYNTDVNDKIIVSSHHLQDTVDSGIHQYIRRYQLDIGCNLHMRVVHCVFRGMHTKPERVKHELKLVWSLSKMTCRV